MKYDKKYTTVFVRFLSQITPGGTIELDSFQEDEEKNNKANRYFLCSSIIHQQYYQDLRSPERMSHKNMVADLNSRNPGLKR